MCMLLDCSCHGDYIKPRSGDGVEKPGEEVEKTPTQSTAWGVGGISRGRRRRSRRAPDASQAPSRQGLEPSSGSSQGQGGLGFSEPQ